MPHDNRDLGREVRDRIKRTGEKCQEALTAIRDGCRFIFADDVERFLAGRGGGVFRTTRPRTKSSCSLACATGYPSAIPAETLVTPAPRTSPSNSSKLRLTCYSAGDADGRLGLITVLDHDAKDSSGLGYRSWPTAVASHRRLGRPAR
jgi:hypothetical protein